MTDGIKKLRAMHTSGSTTLWRGMKNLRVSATFMIERHGGTEVRRLLAPDC